MTDTPIPAQRLSDERLQELRREFSRWTDDDYMVDAVRMLDELLTRRATATTQAAREQAPRLRELAIRLDALLWLGSGAVNCRDNALIGEVQDALLEIAATVEGDSK